MFFFEKIPIIDDDVVRICLSDMIGWDNKGTKGVILGQLVLKQPVSDYYLFLVICSSNVKGKKYFFLKNVKYGDFNVKYGSLS